MTFQANRWTKKQINTGNSKEKVFTVSRYASEKQKYPAALRNQVAMHVCSTNSCTEQIQNKQV
jgi:hypothetical protein